MSYAKWAFVKDALGNWRWRAMDDFEVVMATSDIGFKRLLDCMKDARAHGYDPVLHVLNVERPDR
jgi:hypothetical protein